MTGRKTHEQQIRTLERKADLPDLRRTETELRESAAEAEHHREPRRSARASEFPVSRAGMNQESRGHSKQNRGGRSGHKGQTPQGSR